MGNQLIMLKKKLEEASRAQAQMESDFQARLLALQSENPNVAAASLRTTVARERSSSEKNGDTSSPSSVAFIEANHAIYAGMGIRISCDHSVDFVRSMIPHHAGGPNV